MAGDEIVCVTFTFLSEYIDEIQLSPHSDTQECMYPNERTTHVSGYGKVQKILAPNRMWFGKLRPIILLSFIPEVKYAQ